MKKHLPVLFTILLIGLGLRIFSIATPTLHPWDEQYHALVAKNCMEAPLKPMLYKKPVLEYDYRNWTGNHVWLHKQPVPLWIMAASMTFFGVHPYGLRIPSLLLSLTMILVTYLIGKRVFDENTGLIAAFLHAISWITISLTGGWIATDHYDLYFTAFIELAIWFFILYSDHRKTTYLILATLLTGLAVLTKWLPALIAIPVWWTYDLSQSGQNFKRRIRETVMSGLLLIAIVAPWQYYIHANYPVEAAWESEFNLRHITETLEGHDHSISFHFEMMGYHFGELIYICLILLLFRVFRRKGKRELWAVLVWIFLPYLFFTIAKTKMPAYTMIASPAIFLSVGYFLSESCRSSSTILKGVLIKLTCFGLLAIPLFRTVQWVYNTQKNKTHQANHQELLHWSYSDSTVVFNFPEPIKAMFFQDATVYSSLPAQPTINRLIAEGYEIILHDWANIPDDLRNRGDIKIIDLLSPAESTSSDTQR